MIDLNSQCVFIKNATARNSLPLLITQVPLNFEQVSSNDDNNERMTGVSDARLTAFRLLCLNRLRH